MTDYLPSLPDLKQLEQGLDISETSCIRKVEVQEHLSFLPWYIGRLDEGITEHLNRKVLRYSDRYGGVLLSYSKPLVLQSLGRILDEQPHIHFDVKFWAYIFRPTVGSVLCGTVNKIGGDHVGCLVYNCFNAAIVKQSGVSKGWFDVTFEMGSRIWFRVINLETVGGILSIKGEHFTFHNHAASVFFR